ncbi:hypothetical protein DY000_02055729 [Brassica cretica]|uniref:Uncharacterized protein n=1 Tax=Brassica cretica TaxID=69181 RepID=A0ABQ7AF42_BRACR|nr:hypothetical protein DY000_02055729 [Brassica cretica]
MDGDETKGAMVNEDEQRGFETVVEELLLPVASGGRLAMFKTKLGLLASKNFIVSTLERCSRSEATTSILLFDYLASCIKGFI